MCVTRIEPANGSVMTRKFLLCFPLRVGNIVFGYTVIIISIAVMAYNLYCLGLTVVPQAVDASSNQTTTTPHEGKFRNWQHLEQLFGKDHDSLEAAVTMIYYLSYIIISFFMFLFVSVFLCGAYKANHCLVSSFFVYSFVHLFLSVALVVFEATSRGYIQLGLLLASDVLLIICLFGVKYLMEAIQAGNIYSRPGEVLYRYEY